MRGVVQVFRKDPEATWDFQITAAIGVGATLKSADPAPTVVVKDCNGAAVTGDDAPVISGVTVVDGANSEAGSADAISFRVAGGKKGAEYFLTAKATVSDGRVFAKTVWLVTDAPLGEQEDTAVIRMGAPSGISADQLRTAIAGEARARAEAIATVRTIVDANTAKRVRSFDITGRNIVLGVGTGTDTLSVELPNSIVGLAYENNTLTATHADGSETELTIQSSGGGGGGQTAQQVQQAIAAAVETINRERSAKPTRILFAWGLEADGTTPAVLVIPPAKLLTAGDGFTAGDVIAGVWRQARPTTIPSGQSLWVSVVALYADNSRVVSPPLPFSSLSAAERAAIASIADLKTRLDAVPDVATWARQGAPADQMIPDTRIRTNIVRESELQSEIEDLLNGGTVDVENKTLIFTRKKGTGNLNLDLTALLATVGGGGGGSGAADSLVGITARGAGKDAAIVTETRAGNTNAVGYPSVPIPESADQVMTSMANGEYGWANIQIPAEVLAPYATIAELNTALKQRDGLINLLAEAVNANVVPEVLKALAPDVRVTPHPAGVWEQRDDSTVKMNIGAGFLFENSATGRLTVPQEIAAVSGYSAANLTGANFVREHADPNEDSNAWRGVTPYCVGPLPITTPANLRRKVLTFYFGQMSAQRSASNNLTAETEFLRFGTAGLLRFNRDGLWARIGTSSAVNRQITHFLRVGQQNLSSLGDGNQYVLAPLTASFTGASRKLKLTADLYDADEGVARSSTSVEVTAVAGATGFTIPVPGRTPLTGNVAYNGSTRVITINILGGSKEPDSHIVLNVGAEETTTYTRPARVEYTGLLAADSLTAGVAEVFQQNHLNQMVIAFEKVYDEPDGPDNLMKMVWRINGLHHTTFLHQTRAQLQLDSTDVRIGTTLTYVSHIQVSSAGEDLSEGDLDALQVGVKGWGQLVRNHRDDNVDILAQLAAHGFFEIDENGNRTKIIRAEEWSQVGNPNKIPIEKIPVGVTAPSGIILPRVITVPHFTAQTADIDLGFRLDGAGGVRAQYDELVVPVEYKKGRDQNEINQARHRFTRKIISVPLDALPGESTIVATDSRWDRYIEIDFMPDTLQRLQLHIWQENTRVAPVPGQVQPPIVSNIHISLVYWNNSDGRNYQAPLPAQVTHFSGLSVGTFHDTNARQVYLKPRAAKGEPGDTGPKGDKGDKGDDGAQGPAGAAGPKGDTGDAGAPGAQGQRGPAGAQGPEGPAGPQGPPGVGGGGGSEVSSLALTSAQGIGTAVLTLPSNYADYHDLNVLVRDSNGQDAPRSLITSYLAAKNDSRPIRVSGNATLTWDATARTLTVSVGDTFTAADLIGAAAVSAPGPQGERGPQGIQGVKGDTGDAGPAGADGAQGPPGNQGAQGNPGAQGPAGTQGPKGDTGDTGARGPAGIQGDAGPAGPAGAAGAQGPAGQDGADGARGAQGIQGERGPQGPAGRDGADGSDGADGAQGPPGAAGADGAAGPAGAQGDRGPAGADGADGAQGPRGDTGPTGPAGPKGDKGDPGEQGETGPAGPPGTGGGGGVSALALDSSAGIGGAVLTLPSTYESYHDLSLIIRDSNGQDAPRSFPTAFLAAKNDTRPIRVSGNATLIWDRTARTLTVSAGDTFTVAELVGAALVGQPGPQGERGPAGPQGIQGVAGPAGPAGQDGAQGAQGERGPAGQDGADGADGAAGAQGPKGDTGDTGPAGADGATGPAGPAGTDGATGPAGPAGTDGATGPRGPTGPAGSAGADGQDGAIGPRGPAGAAGQDGATGAQGLRGPAGAAGAAGAQGERGLQGPAGQQGPAGADGADGAAGPAGPKGDTGAVGPAGPAGSNPAPEATVGPWGRNLLTAAVNNTVGATGAVDLSGEIDEIRVVAADRSVPQQGRTEVSIIEPLSTAGAHSVITEPDFTGSAGILSAISFSFQGTGAASTLRIDQAATVGGSRGEVAIVAVYKRLRITGTASGQQSGGVDSVARAAAAAAQRTADAATTPAEARALVKPFAQVGGVKIGVNDIGTNAIHTSRLNDRAVTTIKITDGAVTGAKISSSAPLTTSQKSEIEPAALTANPTVKFPASKVSGVATDSALAQVAADVANNNRKVGLPNVADGQIPVYKDGAWGGAALPSQQNVSPADGSIEPLQIRARILEERKQRETPAGNFNQIFEFGAGSNFEYKGVTGRVDRARLVIQSSVLQLRWEGFPNREALAGLMVRVTSAGNAQEFAADSGTDFSARETNYLMTSTAGFVSNPIIIEVYIAEHDDPPAVGDVAVVNDGDSFEYIGREALVEGSEAIASTRRSVAAAALAAASAQGRGDEAFRAAGVADAKAVEAKRIADSKQTQQQVDLRISTKVKSFAREGGGQISSEDIRNGAVGTDQLADRQVTSAKLGGGAVTAGKIGNNAVATANIQDGAVTAAKIAGGGFLTASQVDTRANNRIVAMVREFARAASRLIRGSDIENRTITADKIANGVIPADQSSAVAEARRVADAAAARNTEQDTLIAAQAAKPSLPSGGTAAQVAARDANGNVVWEFVRDLRPTASPGDRKDTFDFNTLASAGNSNCTGIWSDGETMYVVDGTDDKIYAYDLTTKARIPAKDFNTLVAAGNRSPAGLWSDGVTMYVGDSSADKIFAYNLTTKARISSRDFNTLAAAGNGQPSGLWSDGVVMYVGDGLDNRIYRYNLATKAVIGISSSYIRTSSCCGLWGEGDTLYVLLGLSISAFNRRTGARDTSKQVFNLPIHTTRGIWSDGVTMYVGSYRNAFASQLSVAKIFAFHLVPESVIFAPGSIDVNLLAQEIVARLLPPGGTTNQVAVRTASGGVRWVTLPGVTIPPE